MLAPAPGMTPITSPIRLVQTMCHQCLKAMAMPSKVAAQLVERIDSRPRSVRIESFSMMMNASETANSPTRAGISGTPS